MNLYIRCAILAVAALALAGCQTNDGPHKLGGGIAKSSSGKSWHNSVGEGFREYHSEPTLPSWVKSTSKKKASRSRIGSIRKMARRLAPPGTNVSTLTRMVGKSSHAKISCIPADLRMILNTVAWHYGKRVHVQSGYRSRRHNRRVGGARRSYHMSCQAVDIQVRGVNKYKLAKFLKSLPGRGGVGTYCNSSTVHIDVGPRRAWHYGCGNKSKARRRLARYKRKKRRHKSYK